jgi:hypothetical protein
VGPSGWGWEMNDVCAHCGRPWHGKPCPACHGQAAAPDLAGIREGCELVQLLWTAATRSSRQQERVPEWEPPRAVRITDHMRRKPECD